MSRRFPLTALFRQRKPSQGVRIVPGHPFLGVLLHQDVVTLEVDEILEG
jgi:hypothetical protein